VNLQDFSCCDADEAGDGRIAARGTERRNILFLGRLHPGKGLELLLQALQELSVRSSCVHLFIAGSGDPGYAAQLRDLATDLGVQDQITFTGFLVGRAKISLMQSCDLFVLPTSQENFGLAQFESLAAGTPVLTTRATDTWQELEASGGVAFSEQDPLDLARNIYSLLDDADLLCRMGELGRQWILDRYSSERVIESYVAAYSDAIRSYPTAARPQNANPTGILTSADHDHHDSHRSH